jgi:DNA-directed RNA polymerase subunit RPC12/RpoP
VPDLAREPFGEAETRYRDLRQLRAGRALTAREFRSAVKDLAVRDGEGHEWLLGPEDGSWYRRDRDRWTEAEPPRRLVCPGCGHRNLVRHSFCVQCGQKLERVAAEPPGLAAPPP